MTTRSFSGSATSRTAVRFARAGAFALLSVALPLSVQAQRQTPEPVLGAPGEKPYVAPRRGFNLLGNADQALSGLRMSGTMAFGVSNIGPCSEGAVGFNENGCGNLAYPTGGSASTTFEIVLSAGAPPHDFRKIRAVYPGVNNHLGPQGYTQLSSHLRVGAGSQDWGPADNTLGRLFSGVTSTTDGSCRDNSGRANNFMVANITLLAGSDCPPTWAGGKFEGPRPIGDSAFIRLQQRQGNAFTFDYFKVPADERDNSKFLGSFSTYGLTSDHYAEHLARYGNVTPKGSATAKPVINGFPLGLDVYFEAFSFNRPQIANVAFYQMLVINNSKDVYGTGIDYDSLYMGIMHGYVMAGQNASIYSLPHRNASFANRPGVTAGCNGGTANIPGSNTATCPPTTRGFVSTHAFGIVMLKSPIGDTRNKLLTRPGPFFNPASPYADDTITFNHDHACGFGGSCFNTSIAVNDRRGFGLISSTEANILDGRDPGSVGFVEAWGTFRSRAHPALPNTVFNRYVPGTWSYENKLRVPGQSLQDTIFFDTCEGSGFITIANQNGGQPLPRCSVAFSDTMPGKQINGGPSNIGGPMTAGPFRLKAGDTTSFVIAFLAARDSGNFEALVNAATDAYLSFYLGPDAPPTPTIAGAFAASAEERDQIAADPFVRLTFTDEPEVFTDPFFDRYALDLKSSQDPTFKRLRNINPKLADTVAKIAQNNFAELWIFKSCDNGATFTNDADCAGDPTTGPAGTLGLGWQPYGIVKADANGNIPNTFVDNNVVPGRTYLYSLVTRSRGLTLAIRDLDPTDATAACAADTTFTACKKIERIFTVADTATSTIPTSGPSTAKVYVPISLPAGGTASSFFVNRRGGTSTLPVRITRSGKAVTGDYRLVFGNRFIVQQTINTATQATFSTVRVQDVIASATTDGTNTVTNYVENETILSGPGKLDFTPVTAYTPQITTGPGVRVETDTMIPTAPNNIGFALAQGGRPLFVSLSVIDTGVTPTTPEAFAARSDFPGFVVSVNNVAADTLALEKIVRANGDSVQNVLMNANSIQFRQENTTRRNGRGEYRFVFSDDAFGPGQPFVATGTDATAGPAFRKSIADRAVAVVGDTSARIKAIVTGSTGGAAIGPNLLAVRFPFTVTSAAGNPIILAAPKRTTQAGGVNSFVLGNGGDTVRVQVDSMAWLPGDPFVVLEVLANDSVVAGKVVIGANGKRITQLDTVVAFMPAVLGCNTPRTPCNPVKFPGVGATGYLPMRNGDRIVINYPFPFTLASDIDVRLNNATASAFTQKDLGKVRVVPNPFVVQSQYAELNGLRTGDPRILFTGVPPQGTLRIYSISGQFLQQLSWTRGDLRNDSGDLPWNLRTREGTIVSSGLYIFVIRANDERGKSVSARGKFVIIR